MKPLFFILLTLSTYFIQAQSVTMHHYGVTDGMPSTEVYDVLQDSKGFLWFSTDNGVVKFDGFEFKHFTVADGLPDPVVFEAIEDSSGKIWFRTFSGKIAYVENGKIQPYKFNDQLTKACEGAFLFSMVPDNKGQIWFSVEQQWGYIDADGKLTMHKIPPNTVLIKTLEDRYVMGQYRILPGIEKVMINDLTFPVRLTDHFSDPKKSHTVCRSIFWKGELYFSINNNIFRYDGLEVRNVYRGEAAIINLSKDRTGNLWVGFFNGGALRFNENNFQNPWRLASVGQNSVTKVAEDNEGGIWITTLENGAYYIPNLNIQHYSLNSISKISSVLSSDDRILIGEYDGTLTQLNATSKKLVSKANFALPVLALFDTRKDLWVSAAGLFLINNQKRKSIAYETYRDITEDDDGNIWAIDGSGVAKFDRQGNLAFKKSKRANYRNIFATDSVLLVGLHTGLNIFDREFELISSPKQLSTFKISKVTRLANSVFLVATIGNGFLITRDFKTFTHHLSPARNIYDVVHSNTTVWLATEKGVLKTTVQSLASRQPSYDFITIRSGLLNTQVSHLALTEDELFAFYNNSFSIISTSEKSQINHTPTFYIKSLKVNSQPRDYTKVLALPFDQNNIRLDFGFISFNHQEIRTRYRLDKTASWNELTERTIDLYSLSPGSYALDLQYSLDGIHWTKILQMPVINISPPWWQTIKFLIAAIVAIAFVVFLFFYNRLVIYRQRVEKMKLLGRQQEQLIRTEMDTLERERGRIAKDLHDSVGTNILATKLTVSRLLKKHNDPESESVETQFHDTLREIKEIIYDLYPPDLERYGLATGIKNYVDRIASSTTVKFNVNTFGSALLDAKICVPLYRVLQELITNSLKHSQAKSISIHLNSFDDLYNIVYEDTGTGFSMSEVNLGLGLPSIESRINAINGKIRFQSSSVGVSYTIDVPIRKG